MTCDPVPEVKEPVAVLGAGTMGHGIAHVTALAGCETRLFDIDSAALDRARSRIGTTLARGVELGKVESETRDAALARLSFVTDLEHAVTGAAVVIEAVPEIPELKRRVLADAGSFADPTALVASNTSSLSISLLGESVPGPERFLGMHFFNPVHLMPLVEIVRGDRTTERAVEWARSFARALGKEPIVVRDSPGFASSRLGIALGLEAIRMLEAGVASAPDIDRAMELGYRHPMGPLRLTDLVGLDVRLEIARHLQRELGERFRPPPLLERMVEEGRLGRKSGEGFYTWSDD